MRRLAFLAPFLLACTAISGVAALDIATNPSPDASLPNGQDGGTSVVPNDARSNDQGDGSTPTPLEDGAAVLTDGNVDDVAPQPPRPCPIVNRVTALCAQFNSGRVDEAFVGKTERGGTLTLDSTLSVSAPSSLKVSIPASTPSARADLLGAVGRPKTFLSLTTSFHYTGVTTTITAFQLELGPDEIKVRVSAAGTEFRETIRSEDGGADTVVTNQPIIGLVPNVWQRVELRIDFTQTGSTATIKSGVAVLADHIPVRAHQYLQNAELKVGSITDVNVTQPFTLHFDDVVVEHD